MELIFSKIFWTFVVGVVVALRVNRILGWISNKLRQHFFVPIWRILFPAGGRVWAVEQMVKGIMQ